MGQTNQCLSQRSIHNTMSHPNDRHLLIQWSCQKPLPHKALVLLSGNGAYDLNKQIA